MVLLEWKQFPGLKLPMNRLTSPQELILSLNSAFSSWSTEFSLLLFFPLEKLNSLALLLPEPTRSRLLQALTLLLRLEGVFFRFGSTLKGLTTPWSSIGNLKEIDLCLRFGDSRILSFFSFLKLDLTIGAKYVEFFLRTNLGSSSTTRVRSGF